MSGTWAASFVVMWGAVIVLLGLVLALLRQVGVLHVRLDDVQAELAESVAVARSVPSPEGVADTPAEEGPPVGEPAPLASRLGYERAPMTVVGFVAEGCELSQLLRPALRRVDKQYGEAVRVVELPLGSRTLGVFEEFRVQATPFVVCVDRDGVVRARGRARSLPQLEALVASAGAAAVAARKAARAAVAPPPVTVAAGPAGPAGETGPTIVLDAAEPAVAAPVAADDSPAPVGAAAERDPASASA